MRQGLTTILFAEREGQSEIGGPAQNRVQGADAAPPQRLQQRLGAQRRPTADGRGGGLAVIAPKHPLHMSDKYLNCDEPSAPMRWQIHRPLLTLYSHAALSGVAIHSHAGLFECNLERYTRHHRGEKLN